MTGNWFEYFRWCQNSQHFYCCSLVLAYSFWFWLQSTLPSIQFWPSLYTELFVATETIVNPRRLKDVFVNRINNCCPSYATKAWHLASQPSRPQTVPPESKLPLKIPVSDICRLQTADCRLQTADCRLQTADCRLQTADCRLQITD